MQSLLEAMPQMAAVLDCRGQVQLANARWRTALGACGSPGRWWLRRLPPALRQALWQRLRNGPDAPANGLATAAVHLGRLDDGQRWLLQLPNAPSGGLQALQPSTADNARQHERMLDASVDCIKLIHPDGTLRHMNRSGCRALGLPEDEQDFGMVWLERLPADIRRAGRRALAQALSGRNARFAGKSVVPGKAPQYWDNLLTPVCGVDGRVTGIVCVSRDITAQRVAEQRLRHSSDTDALTGLPNRRTLKRRLSAAIGRARAAGRWA